MDPLDGFEDVLLQPFLAGSFLQSILAVRSLRRDFEVRLHTGRQHQSESNWDHLGQAW